jgi:hypothetical protein
MKTLEIKTIDFIDWYFNSGSDQEQKEIIFSLGKKAVNGLLQGSITILPQDILDECNIDFIPLNLVVGYENSDLEIGEGFSDYEVNLI